MAKPTEDPSAQDRPFGKEAVREALITAAARLIARSGVSGVTTRAIADEARVNQGLITRYFGSKTALIREVAHDLANAMFDQVVDGSLQLEDLFLRGGTGREESLRALMQILFDPELSREGLVMNDVLERFSAWVSPPGLVPGDDRATRARVFLVAALFLGAELVTPRTRVELNLTDQGLHDLKKDAFALFLEGFRAPR